MVLPDPQPGLVISYSYLWHAERLHGRVEGTKNRPCAIVLAITNEEGVKTAFVAPITHSAPADIQSAAELPAATKERLGLDSGRSWVVFSEVNSFAWPGVDLAPIPGNSARFDYGFLPPRLFKTIVQRFAERARARKVAAVNRDG